MRVYRMMVLALVALAATSCGGAPAPAATPRVPPPPAYLDDLNGAVFDPPRVLTDFTFDSTTGEPFRLADHRGEIVLIYFGYRTCPDFCPTTFTELRQIYLELEEPADRVKVLFVTVDPERDTLDLMTQYVGGFHQDFIGLRAEGDPLQSVMDQFGVVAEKRPLGDSPLAYLIDHTASIFLINPDGRLMVQYLYGTDYRLIRDDLQRILQAET
ncbi:MAG: SCO family protein [Chloroflexi bacterium]|nr:SCO family protein [Chloroflexota bacterium]